MEVKIRIQFIKKYGEGSWVKINKYVKKGLSESEISRLMIEYMSHDSVARWIRRIKNEKTDN